MPPDEGAAPEPRATSPRTILLGVGLIVVIAVGLVLLLGKAAGYSEVITVLTGASGPWLAACLGLEVVSYAGYVVSLRAVVAQGGGPWLSPANVTRMWLASLGASRIVSPAGAGGIAIIYWLLRKAGLGPSGAVSRVLGFNVLVFAIFGAWAFATALVILVSTRAAVPLGMVIPWLVVIPATATAGIWISQGARGERVASDTHRGWWRKVLAGAVAGVIVARSALRPPEVNSHALYGAVAYWAGDVACLWGALRAIGADVSLGAVGLAYATAYLAMLIPLPTGGFGAIDAAAIFTLTVLGIPLAEAIAGVVVWRFFNFWLPTIPALIELARSRELGRALAAQAAGPGPPRRAEHPR